MLTQNRKDFVMSHSESNYTQFSNYPDILTVSEVAKMLRIGKNKAYELIRSESIPSKNLGSKQIRISKQAVVEFFTAEIKEYN
jgi:excisionase family DNA binding protein